MCTSGGGCPRRQFLKAAAISVAGLGALGHAGAAEKEKPPPTRVLDDPRVEHGKVVFKHTGKDTFDGFLARPRASGVFPGVLVITGSTIAEEYIPNTCAALALAGFVGLAPNIFHAVPENATDEDRGRILKDHTIFDALEDIQVGADYLRTQSFVGQGGFGIVGFCYGGWLALLTAARSRQIEAVVAYHPGIGRDREELSQLRAPVQLHQGTADHSIDPRTAAELRDRFKAQNAPVELFQYDGADHGFLAYTREFYRADYAELSWSRTTRFLAGHLKGK